jgi:hypothetical protein
VPLAPNCDDVSNIKLVTIAHYIASGPMLKAWLDNIQHRYNPNWSCPLAPFDLRPGEGAGAGGGEGPYRRHA